MLVVYRCKGIYAKGKSLWQDPLTRALHLRNHGANGAQLMATTDLYSEVIRCQTYWVPLACSVTT